MGKNSELSTHSCTFFGGPLNKESEGSPTKASRMKKVVSSVNITPTYDPVLDKYILMGVF